MTHRIGVFGGTFDPPHLGHLILASEALAQLKLTRLLWVLTAVPPHKLGEPISSLDERLEMVELAIRDEAAFELSRIEIDRPGPHYTLDTLHMLAEGNPGTDLVFLIGGDSLHDIPTWHQPIELVRACDEIGVMRRPGDSVDLSALEGQIPGLTAKVRFIDAPLLEIASRQIRQRASAGQPFRYYLLPSVYDYVIEHDLYQKR